MHTRKRSCTDSDDKRRRAKKHILVLQDGDRTLRLTAFENRAATKTLGQRLRELIMLKEHQHPLSTNLYRYLEGLPYRLRKRLKDLGLLPAGFMARATKPRGPAICGIPVTIKNRRLRGTIRRVLAQIRSRRPADFKTLRRKVLSIDPLSNEETADGTAGQFEPLLEPAEEFGMHEEGHPPGRICLPEDSSGDEAMGTIAHELGHACTTLEDRERRGNAGEEWASELAADWYAYRWGFGRQIAKDRKRRRLSHHCSAPGKWIEEGGGGKICRYEVTRNFRLKLVKCYKGRIPVSKGKSTKGA